MNTEQWKDISEIEGLEDYAGYKISTLGRIKNKHGKLLNPSVNEKGYLRVNLSGNGNRRKMRVHRLVALAFIPNDDISKTQVNHINEDKTDNRIDNLEWCTSEYNINYGSHNKKVAATLSKQIFCPELSRIFAGARDAERELGIDKGGINRCCNHKQKTCMQKHWYFIDIVEL